MASFDPGKLSVTFMEDVTPGDPVIPRAYTLTHSDSTGDLFLSIGMVYNKPQISGWYTRLMRDEILAEWQFDNEPSFHVHCHVSGGFLIGSSGWRYSIFRKHMPMVLEALRYGDRELFATHPGLDRAKIWVHYHSTNERYNKIENWGQFNKYREVVKE
jgi:hypothetical protein